MERRDKVEAPPAPPMTRGVVREVAKVELVEERDGIVTTPLPKVTARLVVVLMPRVPAPVMSKIVLLPASATEVELIVVAPVPVAKVLLPVTVVAPFKDTAPVPVAKVLLPVTVVAPFKDTAPVPVAKVLAPVTEVAPFKETAPVPVLKVLAPV